MKPVLFVDIDGTVADSMRWWLNLASVKNWKTYPFDGHTTYDTKKCLGIDLSEFYEDYRGVEYVDGARDALVRLGCYYDIRYVTVGHGEQWLRAQGVSGEVIRIKDRSLLRGYALIDDYNKNLEGFIGRKFLVKQPWNPSGWTWKDIEDDLMGDAYAGFSTVVVGPV